MSFSKKILFSLLCLTIFFVFAEIIARLLESNPVGTPLETHPQRGWQLPKAAVDRDGHPIARDENGLRPTEQLDKEWLIYTMGDSSVFGHGLADNQTLHAHITRICSQLGISAQAITGAVPGYSSVQSLHQLNSVGWSLKPNLLIIGNLWSDNDIITSTQLPEDPKVRKEEDSWLMHQSALWRTLNQKLNWNGDPLAKIGWMEEWHNKSGFRRVAPTRYAQTLDTILSEAARRNISVLFLSPCNVPLSTGEKLEGGYPWDVYFDILRDVAQRRGVGVISGCDAAQKHDQTGASAFLDRMHPTDALNQAYAHEIVQYLKTHNWPQQTLIPQKDISSYSKKWPDPWPTVYPEPPSRTDLQRPDNLDLNMKGPQKMGRQPVLK